MIIERFGACGGSLVLRDAKTDLPAHLFEWLQAHDGSGHYNISSCEWKRRTQPDRPLDVRVCSS